jgi:transcriptional regulator with PAS, ATPase and Fis domain
VGSQSEKIKGMKLAKDKPSLVRWAMENKQLAIAEPGSDPRHCKEVEEGLDVKSTLILCFPMFQNKTKKVLGAIEIIDTSAGGLEINLDPEYLALLQDLIDIGSITLSYSLSHAKQLTRNRSLQEAIEEIRFDSFIVGVDSAFQEVMGLVKSYSATDYPVILYGESGTGKELVAHELHRRSPRAQKPFLIQNCSAIPETLLESELFGYKKGAFTGADKDKAGLFESADGGTVFLDEIGEMDVQLQAKLLRTLQNNEIKPLGGSAKKVDVRIISATNLNLERAVQEKKFREDLYYRLNVLPLQLPPLRERSEDIPLLINHFLKREAVRSDSTPKHITPSAMRQLKEYSWPGNVRELENMVKQLLALSTGTEIDGNDLPARLLKGTRGAPPLGPQLDQDFSMPLDGLTWKELDRNYAVNLLTTYKWNVSLAAKAAGMSRSTFSSRLKSLGIRKSDVPAS